MGRGSRMRGRGATWAVAWCVAMALAAPAHAAQRYGFVTVPTDEHQHVDGWDYWWGASDLVTRSGNRYTLAVAYTIFDGGADIASSYQLFPRQGPYKGKAVQQPRRDGGRGVRVAGGVTPRTRNASATRGAAAPAPRPA